MNNYNPSAVCPKCGHDVISTVWQEGCREDACELHPEGLHRTCRRCSYGWAEKPLDPEVPET